MGRKAAHALRIAGLALVVALLFIAWAIVLITHDRDWAEGEPPPPAVEYGTIGVAVTLALAAGLLSRRRTWRRLGLAASAALVLAVWSLLLLDHTPYLEPLPWSAAWLAVGVLVTATLGAALLSGAQWWTLLALPAALVGFFHLSEDLYESGSEATPYHSSVATGLWLVLLALPLGALAARFAAGPARVAGAAMLLLPIAVLAWAGLRHASPIDRRVSHPLLVRHPALPASPSYRGVRIGDPRRRLLALLGKPDRIIAGDGIDRYIYGTDAVWYAREILTGAITRRDIVSDITVRDGVAETPEGVGIGDNLAIARKRYPGISCFVLYFEIECGFFPTYGGASGYASVTFYGDPIDRIEIGGIPP